MYHQLNDERDKNNERGGTHCQAAFMALRRSLSKIDGWKMDEVVSEWWIDSRPDGDITYATLPKSTGAD